MTISRAFRPLLWAALPTLWLLAGCANDTWDGADDDSSPGPGDDDVSSDDDQGDDDTATTDDDASDDDTTPADDDDDTVAPVDCSLISAANPAWEVCETGVDFCNGVFTDGAGCTAYCAAASLVCTARFGGEPGCQKEPENPLTCGEVNGHNSDWCDCGLPEGDDDDSGCESDPANMPYYMDQDYTQAAYTERHNWVLTCYPYAYTASGDEHMECDGDYSPDGSRTGTATFTFQNVPRGWYDAYMGGRHTANRNPSGALFIVDGNSVVIDQVDESGDYVWDYHGHYCLEGTVEVVLDSSVNSGSDSVSGVRLEP